MYERLHICSDMIDNEQEVKKTTITFLWARNEAFNQKIDIIISMQLNHRTQNIEHCNIINSSLAISAKFYYLPQDILN